MAVVDLIGCKPRKFTDKKRRRYLEELSRCGNLTNAAKSVGMSRTGLQLIRRSDPVFESQVQSAIEIAIDALEEEAFRRAHHGVDEPVFFKGETCGTVKKYSDRLMEVLLRAHRPHKYREGVDLNVTGSVLHQHSIQTLLAQVDDLTAPLVIDISPSQSPPEILMLED